MLWRADGTSFPAEYWSQPQREGGEIYGAVITFNDISERRRIEKQLADDIVQLRAMQEELSASRRNFSDFFNLSVDFLFVLDVNGAIITVNRTVLTRLGYSEQELLGHDVSVLHPGEADKEVQNVIACMRRGECEVCGIPLQAKDGKLIPVETRVIRAEWNGEPAIFGITRDITAIQASEAKFRAAFDYNIALMTVSTIAEGVFLDVNLAFLEALGYERADVIGKSVFALELYDDPAVRMAVIKEVQDTGRCKNREITLRAKSGKQIDGLMGAVQLSVSPEPLLLAIMYDITDRKDMERSLRAKTEELERYFTSSLDLLCIATIEGTFIRLNPQWEHVLGYPICELEGTRFLDYVHPDDRSATLQTMSQLERKEDITSFTNRYRCKNGAFRWIEWRSTNADNLVYAVARDVTERNNQEEQIRQANTELSKAKDALELMTVVMFSHSICPECMEKLYPELRGKV